MYCNVFIIKNRDIYIYMLLFNYFVSLNWPPKYFSIFRDIFDTFLKMQVPKNLGDDVT